MQHAGTVPEAPQDVKPPRSPGKRMAIIVAVTVGVVGLVFILGIAAYIMAALSLTIP